MANVCGDLLLMNAEAEETKMDITVLICSESFSPGGLQSSLLLFISTGVVFYDWERLEFIAFFICMYVCRHL